MSLNDDQTKTLKIFSISRKHIEINLPAEPSSILNNELTLRISYKIPDWFNINMNFSGYFENFTLFSKLSTKIEMLPVQDYHVNLYNKILASNKCVEVIPSLLEKSGISNNYHLYHSKLEPFIHFINTHEYIIMCFLPIISGILINSMIKLSNICLEVSKMLSSFLNHPRLLALSTPPFWLPTKFIYHNLDMLWYVIAKLLGLFEIYKSLLLNYIKGLVANLKAKLYLAHFKRVMDSYLSKEKIKRSLNLVKSSIQNTNRGIEKWADYISKSGKNFIDLCSISLVCYQICNPLCLPNEIRRMIQEYILMSKYRELISEYIEIYFRYILDAEQIRLEIHNWITDYTEEQRSIHPGVAIEELNLSRTEALADPEVNGWYLYEQDMNHLAVITDKLSDVWEDMEGLLEKAISWGYPQLIAEFQEHIYLRLELPFWFLDSDSFFNRWIEMGFNF